MTESLGKLRIVLIKLQPLHLFLIRLSGYQNKKSVVFKYHAFKIIIFRCCHSHISVYILFLFFLTQPAPRVKSTINIHCQPKFGGPTWIRTRDRPVMSRWLYQTELWAPPIWRTRQLYNFHSYCQGLNFDKTL